MLSKKYLEEEIKKTNIAIEHLEQGLDLHKLMLEAFEEALKKCG